jgi:hypothetical protein
MHPKRTLSNHANQVEHVLTKLDVKFNRETDVFLAPALGDGDGPDPELLQAVRSRRTGMQEPNGQGAFRV